MGKHDAAAIGKIAEGYQKDPYRLMDVVREVHKQEGHLSGEVIDEIAKAMGIHRVQVEDMASFYSFFSRESAGVCTIRLSNCVVDQMHSVIPA